MNGILNSAVLCNWLHSLSIICSGFIDVGVCTSAVSSYCQIILHSGHTTFYLFSPQLVGICAINNSASGSLLLYEWVLVFFFLFFDWFGLVWFFPPENVIVGLHERMFT